MFSLLIVAIVLVVATGFGLWDKKRAGKIKEIVDSRNLIASHEIGS